MPVMTSLRRAVFDKRKKRKCLCCYQAVRLNERYIVVASIGIQHQDPCPRRDKTEPDSCTKCAIRGCMGDCR